MLRPDDKEEERRQSGQHQTWSNFSPEPISSHELPEMNPSPRRNNDGNLDNKERWTIETLPIEKAHRLNPA